MPDQLEQSAAGNYFGHTQAGDLEEAQNGIKSPSEIVNNLPKGLLDSTGNPTEHPEQVSYMYIARGEVLPLAVEEGGKSVPRVSVLGAFVDQKDAENTIRADTHSDKYVQKFYYTFYPRWNEYIDTEGCLHLESDKKDELFEYKLWVEKVPVKPKGSVRDAEVFDEDVHVPDNSEDGSEGDADDDDESSGDDAKSVDWAQNYSNARDE
jgi:hypothetical protein